MSQKKGIRRVGNRLQFKTCAYYNKAKRFFSSFAEVTLTDPIKYNIYVLNQLRKVCNRKTQNIEVKQNDQEMFGWVTPNYHSGGLFLSDIVVKN